MSPNVGRTPEEVAGALEELLSRPDDEVAVKAIWQWNGTKWEGYLPEADGVPGANDLSELRGDMPYSVVIEPRKSPPSLTKELFNLPG